MRLRSSRDVPKERDVDAQRRKGGDYFLSVLKEVFHHLGSDQSAGVDDENMHSKLHVNLHDKDNIYAWEFQRLTGICNIVLGLRVVKARAKRMGSTIP
jgi:hypothetical protein